MATQKINIIEPKSFTLPELAEYEYFLLWIGRKGEFIHYLFTDYEQTTQVRNEVVNSENSSNTRSIIQTERDTKVLTFEDLNRSEFLYYKSVLVSPYIYKSDTSGNLIRLAIIEQSIPFRNSDNKYQFSIEVEEPLRAVAN